MGNVIAILLYTVIVVLISRLFYVWKAAFSKPSTPAKLDLTKLVGDVVLDTKLASKLCDFKRGLNSKSDFNYMDLTYEKGNFNDPAKISCLYAQGEVLFYVAKIIEGSNAGKKFIVVADKKEPLLMMLQTDIEDAHTALAIKQMYVDDKEWPGEAQKPVEPMKEDLTLKIGDKVKFDPKFKNWYEMYNLQLPLVITSVKTERDYDISYKFNNVADSCWFTPDYLIEMTQEEIDKVVKQKEEEKRQKIERRRDPYYRRLDYDNGPKYKQEEVKKQEQLLGLRR